MHLRCSPRRGRLVAGILIAFLAALTLPHKAEALPPSPPIMTETQRLAASDGESGDTFGYSVSVSGDTAIIGAYYGDGPVRGTGSAYVFQDNGAGLWTQRAELTASDGATLDQFGASVAIDGDMAIVGAVADDNERGSAYIFGRNTLGVWTQRAKLIASDGVPSDRFGFPVAISGNRAIVGAFSNDDAGSSSGSAYIFEDNGTGTWSEVAKLTASDAARNDEFGFSVAIDGDTAIVGAHNDDGTGSAYVFQNFGSDAWNEVAKFKASDAAPGADFGYSVAIDGARAVVGARRDSQAGFNAGAAYVFGRDSAGWRQLDKLLAHDLSGSNDFGHSVGISGGRVLVGGDSANGAWRGSGAAYIFEEDAGGDWREVVELNFAFTPQVLTSNGFGWSASLSGDIALVGAWREHFDKGAAYLFNLSVIVPEPNSLQPIFLAGLAMMALPAWRGRFKHVQRRKSTA